MPRSVKFSDHSYCGSSLGASVERINAQDATAKVGDQLSAFILPTDVNFYYLNGLMGCPKITYDYQEEGLEKSTVHFFGQLAQKRGQQKNRINYYPFGLTFNESVRVASSPQDFKFNSKERQTDFNLNWDFFGSRIHMPEIGRFTTIDPKAEKYNFQTPYAYAANNPIRFEEKDGEEPKDKKGGPFSASGGDSYVYRSSSGRVHATRLTTSGRRTNALVRTAAGFTPAGSIADATASIYGGDYSSGATSSGSAISEGLGSFFQAAAKDPSVVNTADVLDNLGKGTKVGGGALMAIPGLINGLSGPTKSEVLEEMTFNVVVRAGAGNVIGGEGNVLRIGNEDATPETVADMLNVIYNGLSEQFSDLDLTSKDGKEAAYKFLKNNFEDFYNSIQYQKNNDDEDETD